MSSPHIPTSQPKYVRRACLNAYCARVWISHSFGHHHLGMAEDPREAHQLALTFIRVHLTPFMRWLVEGYPVGTPPPPDALLPDQLPPFVRRLEDGPDGEEAYTAWTKRLGRFYRVGEFGTAGEAFTAIVRLLIAKLGHDWHHRRPPRPRTEQEAAARREARERQREEDRAGSAQREAENKARSRARTEAKALARRRQRQAAFERVIRSVAQHFPVPDSGTIPSVLVNRIRGAVEKELYRRGWRGRRFVQYRDVLSVLRPGQPSPPSRANPDQPAETEQGRELVGERGSVA